MTAPSLPAGQRPQHTPGDWRASAPDGTYHDVIRIFAADDPEGALPVAVCPQRQSAILSVLSGQTNETTEAACNARLISHAPALLEALREQTAALEGTVLSIKELLPWAQSNHEHCGGCARCEETGSAGVAVDVALRSIAQASALLRAVEKENA